MTTIARLFTVKPATFRKLTIARARRLTAEGQPTIAIRIESPVGPVWLTAPADHAEWHREQGNAIVYSALSA